MVEKMKFLSITGPKEDIDRVVDHYLSKYEIQLENALSELKTVTDLRPFTDVNPYKEEHRIAGEITAEFKDCLPAAASRKVSVEEAVDTIRTIDAQLKDLIEERDKLIHHRDTHQRLLDTIIPFTHLDYDLSAILHFRFVSFRFGRIPHEYYLKFMKYVYDTIDTVIHTCTEDEEYVWVVYFVPETLSDKIDAIFASMHFERFFLPDEYEGTPSEAITRLRTSIDGLNLDIRNVESNMTGIIIQKKEELSASYERLETFSTNFNVRKMAALTKQKENTFYILGGWMAKSDAEKFCAEIEHDEKAFIIVEDDHDNVLSNPPTKLKNPKLFKPFELFIQMYGLPAYEELDPTILLGITYPFLFGFMFGDVGQGLCLLIGGFLLYKFRKMNLAAIISCCGFFSTIFGFLYGSIFGFEHTIEALWLHPKTAVTNLPFIGNLNTVFVVAIALGMGIVMLTMILNIFNSIRNHDPEKAYFDTNGIAGLVFYGAIVASVALFMSGNTLPAAAVLVIMFLVPLLIIFMKEPLTALVEKKVEVMPKEKGMFIVQGFFELFEVLLSYFSNTLSFVRVGAFAVSHAAMMEVVLMLAGAEAGSPNWLVVVLGNLFVCGMEGLIVGIQVLRLEYYELFSRFYKGSGRAFRPYGKDI